MAEKTEGQDAAGLITLDQAGRLLGGITAERVRQLIVAGWIPKAKPGRVLLVAAVQGYIRYLKDQANAQSKTAADSRVRDARAKEIEMRNAVRLRELIPIEEATAEYDALVAAVREEMDGLPARLTRDIEQRRKFETEVHASKKRITEALGEAKGAARSGKPSRRVRTDDA